MHMMVRNEERFIRTALEAVLPIAKEIIVFDTGSTDDTVKIVGGIKSKKIRLFLKGPVSPSALVGLRNEMAEMTKTEWFFVVDGDEIFFIKGQKKALAVLMGLPKSIARVEVTIRDFVNDCHLVARDRLSGKLWRSKTIRFFGNYPFEYGAPRDFPEKDFSEFSSNALKEEVICFHMGFFQRSFRDTDVGVGRHWRKMPFPVLFYFGSYPPNFPIKGGPLLSAVRLILYNAVGVLHVLFHKREQKRDAASGRHYLR